MNTFKFLLVAFATLSINTQTQGEPEVFVDNRRTTRFRQHVFSDADIKFNQNNIDLSAVAVTEVFRALESTREQGTPARRNFVYVGNAEENNEMLVSYRITAGKKYRVVIKTSNDNTTNPDERIHKQVLGFNCKVLDVVEEFMCMPDSCDLSTFEPVGTPGTKCEDHYHESQNIIEYTMESVKNQPDTQDFIECVKEHIKEVVPSPSSMCFFIGFRPNNIVPLGTIEERLLDEGYVRETQPDGTYKLVNRSLVETKVAQVREEQLEDIFSP